jgi:hypothetical protein
MTKLVHENKNSTFHPGAASSGGNLVFSHYDRKYSQVSRVAQFATLEQPGLVSDRVV